MGRRERLEAKLEKRQDWAAGRRSKAEHGFAQADPYRGDVAFNTQPGHIPERARVIRAGERAMEHMTMAEHHDSKAAGLESQLDRSVFSDDDNAVGALEARIAEHEAQRDRMKRVNQLFKKGDAAGLAGLGLALEKLKAKLTAAGAYWGSKPHLPYELTNLGARIRADRERIGAVKAQRTRTEKAEGAGGVLIEGQEYVRVTFAEKPERATLDALKTSGFHWSGGGWCGRRDQIPTNVKEG